MAITIIKDYSFSFAKNDDYIYLSSDKIDEQQFRYGLHFLYDEKFITNVDNQIDDEIKKAEQEIILLRKTAPEKINKIAIDTSSELVQKLIGADVNNSSISAIVEDLSKRNGDKYYGN